MTASQAFEILNLIALAGWVLLALSPKLPRAATTVTGTVIPVLFAVVYVLLIVNNWGEGGFSSLEEVTTLFSNPWILLAGWTHYLAFDLLVGNWELRDSRERHIPYGLVLPCLFGTFLFGPAGWLLYVLLRSFWERFRK